MAHRNTRACIIRVKFWWIVCIGLWQIKSKNWERERGRKKRSESIDNRKKSVHRKLQHFRSTQRVRVMPREARCAGTERWTAKGKIEVVLVSCARFYSIVSTRTVIVWVILMCIVYSTRWNEITSGCCSAGACTLVLLKCSAYQGVF